MQDLELDEIIQGGIITMGTTGPRDTPGVVADNAEYLGQTDMAKTFCTILRVCRA